MKKVMIMVALASAIAASAQVVSVTKTIDNAVIGQTNRSIYNATNQGVNAVFNAPGKIFRKIKSKSQTSPSDNTFSTSPANNTSSGNVMVQDGNSSISKVVDSDFVPGAQVLFSDNFSSTKSGEFPANWITNSSGQVRTIQGQNGQWLQLSANGIFSPNSQIDLPENFTIEFDAIFHATPSKDVHYIFYLYSLKDKVADFKETSYPGNAGVYFAFNTEAGEVDAENFENGKAGIIDSHLVTDLLKSALTNKVRVAIARQKSKLSLYINGTKVFSSPTALPENYTYNALKFGSFFMGNDDFMLLSNLTIATN